MTEYEVLCIEMKTSTEPTDYKSITAVGLEGAHGRVFKINLQRLYEALSEEGVIVSFTVDDERYCLEPVPDIQGVRTKSHDKSEDPLLQLPHC